MKHNYRKQKYDPKIINRLQHIDNIYNSTIGWTIQLMNLYEERKKLRLLVSRMEIPTDG